MKRYSPKPWNWVESFVQGLRYRDVFNDVRSYVLFIGHSRSGSSLVGSLLNAHRNALIAHELSALRFVRARFNRDQLFWLHHAKDKQFERKRRSWTGYDFRVPEQWQGRYEDLQVIGDKRAAMTTIGLQRWPHLLERMQRTVRVPVRFIHTLRHPLDNIASVSGLKKSSVEQAIDWYDNGTRINASVMEQLCDAVHTVKLEEFVGNPRERLAELCGFLGLDAPPDYLNDCANIIFENPQRAWQRVAWTPQQIDRVRSICDQHPFLRGYGFDDLQDGGGSVRPPAADSPAARASA